MSRHQTPLRYPGGKQRLAPFIVEVLQANGLIGGDYVEPYAGGAGVACELLLAGHVSRVHLNDSSLPVVAFWRCVLNHTEQLCRMISRASLTPDEWRRRREVVRNPADHDELELGFSTFYLNRCNRSGVLTGGLIGGLSQTGEWKMNARFPRNELISRIESIAARRSSVCIRGWDAERFIAQYIPRLPAATLVYCDPPYFEKSSRLYLDRYTPDDHKRLAELIQSQSGRRWLVSYDAAKPILRLYRERRRFTYDLQYNASRVYRGREVFVFSDALTIPQGSSLGFLDDALRTQRPRRRRCNLGRVRRPAGARRRNSDPVVRCKQMT